MLIEVKNLRLRTLIGFQPWEKEKLQDVVINLQISFDGAMAARTDEVQETVNYKTITKNIIAMVEASSFNLLETLTERILDIAMADPKVEKALVTVDKPHALRFTESVSVTAERTRDA